jgi:hypothetical protein
MSSFIGLFLFGSIIWYCAQIWIQITELFSKAKYFEDRYRQNIALNSLSYFFVINLHEKIEQEYTTAFGTVHMGLAGPGTLLDGCFPHRMR